MWSNILSHHARHVWVGHHAREVVWMQDRRDVIEVLHIPRTWQICLRDFDFPRLWGGLGVAKCAPDFFLVQASSSKGVQCGLVTRAHVRRFQMSRTALEIMPNSLEWRSKSLVSVQRRLPARKIMTFVRSWVRLVSVVRLLLCRRWGVGPCDLRICVFFVHVLPRSLPRVLAVFNREGSGFTTTSFPGYLLASSFQASTKSSGVHKMVGIKNYDFLFWISWFVW